MIERNILFSQFPIIGTQFTYYVDASNEMSTTWTENSIVFSIPFSTPSVEDSQTFINILCYKHEWVEPIVFAVKHSKFVVIVLAGSTFCQFWGFSFALIIIDRSVWSDDSIVEDRNYCSIEVVKIRSYRDGTIWI